MSDHPSTYNASETGGSGIDWDDRATLHRRDDGDGVLDGFKALRSGTFAELIAFVMRLPESERDAYAIEKAGDRRFGPGEIAALAARDDFPR